MNTYYGANLMLKLAIQKLRRNIYKSSVFGWFFMKYFDYIFKIEVRYKTSKDE